MLPFLRKGASLTEATLPALCQVRSETESPCLRRAVVEIRGVAFCGACAREQKSYFAIGELVAQEEGQDLRSERLAEALEKMRRECAGGRESTPAEPQRGILGVHEAEPLALSNS